MYMSPAPKLQVRSCSDIFSGISQRNSGQVTGDKWRVRYSANFKKVPVELGDLA